VQKVLSAPSPGVARSSPARRDLASEVETSAETAWRQRKQQKQDELEALEGKVEHLREMVTWCNHGGEVVRTDDIGMKHGVSCDDVRSEYETLETRIAAVKHYLDEEIEEECRRSGCLPGWIR